MGNRLPNPNLAKINRNYTVEEVAALYGVHRNTVRGWIKGGLPLCDDRRPLLILGSDLRQFLTSKRTQNKHPLKPGEIYCVRCRSQQKPALQMADFRPLTATTGNLIGLCPQCDGLMYRRAALEKLGYVKGNLNVTHTKQAPHIDDSNNPSVNCDFNPGA